MGVDRDLKTYYRRRRKGGQLGFARAVDYVALRLVFLLGCYLWFRSILPGRTLALLFTALAFAIFVVAARLWRVQREERFRQRERERIAQEIAAERLLLLPSSQIEGLIREITKEDAPDTCLYSLQKLKKGEGDDVLRAWEAACRMGAKKLVLAACCELTPEALALLQRLPVPTKLVTQEQLLSAMAKGQSAVTAAQVDAYIRTQLAGEKEAAKQARSQSFSPGRAGKYAVAAGILFGASFLTAFPLYYRMLGSLCLVLAAACVWLGKGTVFARQS